MSKVFGILVLHRRLVRKFRKSYKYSLTTELEKAFGASSEAIQPVLVGAR